MVIQMFENLIKSKLNIKEQDNLLIVKYKKWSFKLPIYLLIIYILYTKKSMITAVPPPTRNFKISFSSNLFKSIIF